MKEFEFNRIDFHAESATEKAALKQQIRADLEAYTGTITVLPYMGEELEKEVGVWHKMGSHDEEQHVTTLAKAAKEEDEDWE